GWSEKSTAGRGCGGGRGALALLRERNKSTQLHHAEEGKAVGVNVCLPLFGNAGHELEEGAALGGEQLRTLGGELRERLRQAAEALDKLQAAGWSATVAMYDALLAHAAVQTRAEAERRLRELDIDPAGLMIVEEVQEDELA